MELFTTDILKKEYEEFNKKYLPDVLECGYCNKKSCMYHSKFIISCTFCRNTFCKKCKSFNTSKDLLLKSALPEVVDFLLNYISDFLDLSKESLKAYFPNIKIEKIEKDCYKKRVKSEKCRQQTVSVKLPSYLKNGQYQVGKWKRRFYY